jgi:hypothetical protein
VFDDDGPLMIAFAYCYGINDILDTMTHRRV